MIGSAHAPFQHTVILCDEECSCSRAKLYVRQIESKKLGVDLDKPSLIIDGGSLQASVVLYSLFL